MLGTELVLTNPTGLHMRPASVLVQTAQRFESAIRVRLADDASPSVDGKSILSVLGLSAEKGRRLRIEANGPDEAAALAAMVGAVERGLGETIPQPRLTKREHEILALLTARLPRKEIARQLGLAEPTVRNHLTRLYRKLGVHDSRQAAMHAVRRGLVDPQ